jgi:hypothetical protein
MVPFLLSREKGASDPMMFRQCTHATKAVANLLEQRLAGHGLRCATIQGRWIGPLPDRFRLAAKALGKIMTVKNKRDHQWLAVGNAKVLQAVNDVETLEKWYEDAVTVDPTCFQFFEKDEKWTLDPCMVDIPLKMKPVATLVRLRVPDDIVGPIVMPTKFDDVSGNGLGGAGGMRIQYMHKRISLFSCMCSTHARVSASVVARVQLTCNRSGSSRSERTVTWV